MGSLDSMEETTVIKVVRILLLLALLNLTPTPSSAQGPTQRDWMENLVNGLGWSYGLPDEPEEADYLKILDGKRLLRVEAEQAVQQEDMVSIKTYTSFGSFSGEAWVSGIARPTTAHLKFLLPNSGSYQIRASLRLSGHRFAINEQTFEADGADQFTTVQIGEIDLTAGEQEFIVTLPANGAIDYLELQAPGLPPVKPLTGWNLDQPLSLQNLAVTSLRLLGLQSSLPPSGKPLKVEAESATSLGTATITRVAHLGAPSGKAWVRAGAEETRIEMTFIPPTAGVYRLTLRGTGDEPITTVLDHKYSSTREYPPYLEEQEWFSLYLDATPHVLSITLPPRAGFDRLTLIPLSSSGYDYLVLSGLSEFESPPTFATIDKMISLLAPLTQPR